MVKYATHRTYDILIHKFGLQYSVQLLIRLYYNLVRHIHGSAAKQDDKKDRRHILTFKMIIINITWPISGG